MGVMGMSLARLNYQPIFASGQTNHKTKSNPAIAVKVSSAVLATEESKNLLETRKIIRSSTDLTRHETPALLKQENTVGIIGGFSAISTLLFLKKLVCWSSIDGKDCVPFIVCNDPALKGLVSDYSALVCAKDAQTDINHRATIENLRQKRAFLEQSGVWGIVMPCHITHVWHREVSKGCPVTFLNIGDCVAKELKEAELKPLEAGSNVRIGVLAADATLMAGFYQEKILDQGFEVVLPDKPNMEHMVIPAIEALNTKDTEGARNLLRIAIQVLLVRAVNRIILVSDEFRGLLPCDDPLLSKMY